ncbi:MAG: amino acid ABC transporter substrate-binding protein [Propionibacteriales bacterium]|nr:amino acid ABC transporter substrate-binding protein [Propionibacteriales bacterium]
MRRHHALATLACSAALLLTAACGGESLEQSGTDSDGDAGAGGRITLAGQDFPEMQIMSEMYKAVLENAGYTVDLRLVQTRDIYLPELESGAVDVVPEYAGSITDALTLEANGPNAELVSSHDVDDTMAEFEKLAEPAGLTALEPSEATDQNAYAVTEEFAQQHDLTTLTDLGDLGQPIKLAAAPDCEDREDCAVGLKDVYGIDITQVLPLGFGTTQTKDALGNGEVQLGQAGTSDGSLEQLGLVLLEDDQGLQAAQNLVPVVNSEFLDQNPDIAEPLNEMSSTLTTEDLANLNEQVDLERQKPADVAQQYLQDEGLI